MSNSQGTASKVGALAEATGLTVRTLHYYEEIGLLVPSQRSDAGHRLYGREDVERLYRVRVLRRLGLSLDEIRNALDNPQWDLDEALSRHLGELESQLETMNRLRSRVAALMTSVTKGSNPDVDDLLGILEDMTMVDDNVQSRISILVYSDLESIFDFLTGAFALGPGQLSRDGDGNAVHGEIHAGDGVLWLHPESPEYGLSSPKTIGTSTASMAIMVDDVDAHHSHAKAGGATIVYEPVDQPYGYREYSARDPEGGLWSFMKPLT
ncbi:MAG: MerR family transcriptional regulator [Acidimicrobiia bacterium]|nr:MerR family transcriptional regulator [Acidimicrobiia bacterium]